MNRTHRMFVSRILTTTMIIIVIGIAIQTTHAAKNIFTINGKPPKSNGAFGGLLISQQDRDVMFKQNGGRENSVRKAFTLPTPMKYFEDEGRRRNQNTIYVSHFE